MSEKDPYIYSEQWEATFGNILPTRPELGPEDVPMVEECLRTRSKKPYEAWLDKLLKDNPGCVF